ncbi:MAG: 23S rRNA (uracil(1939)-C(5))-methyltransferase RlmD [Acidobacteriota bacterium]
MLSKGQVIDLEIDSAAYQGSGVARFDEFVVFVKNAVPGDRVQARVIKKKRHYAEAVIEELIKPSAHRLEPRCKYFGTCGGCSWQNVNYQQQLIFKHKQVEETFSHLGGLGSVKVCSTLPSPDIYYYRNKMEFSFGTNRWLTQEEIESGREVQKGFALGLHIPKRWDKILDLDVCYLQSPLSAEIVNEVRKIALGKGWSAYDPLSHKGYLRNLVIRTGSNTGEIMVSLVTSRSEPQRVRLLTQVLLKAFPEITTVVNSINSSRSPVAYGTEEIVYHGKGTITDRIAHLVFMITPDAFFQPNTAQAETLCRLVKEFARLDGDQTVYDLYSGSGSFALFLSDRVKKVVAVESHERAVESACKNAAANKIENCVFRRGDVREALTSPFVANYGRPDVLVADPPRAGMHKDVCRAILALAPERVVYVSCNPATQARDLKILCQQYEIEAIQPVDMFPHTYHIENVVALVDAATE